MSFISWLPSTYLFQTSISKFIVKRYSQSVFHFNTKEAAVQVLVLHQSVKYLHVTVHW